MPRKKTTTRRGNGEGSIYQRKDGLWISQIVVGLKPNGKPDRKTFTGRTRAEVATKLIPYLNPDTGKVHAAREDVTIEKHMTFWLMNYKSTTVKSRTLAKQVGVAKKHIFPAFGNLRPKELTADLLQPYFRKLLEEYQLDTVKKIKYIFSEYLEYCLDRGLTDTNPIIKIKFKGVKALSRKNAEERVEKAMPEELREPFIKALNTDRFFKAFCLTAMFAGLRPGEVLGLRWRDFDACKETLSIVRAQTIEYKFDKEGNIIDTKSVIGDTKTAGSVRTNPIPKLLVDTLTEWKRHRTTQQKETGYSLVAPTDYIFGTNQGELRSYSGTKHMFDRFLKKHGLADKGIHFYALRHTFSNTLFEQNTNPRVVQSLMGHRKIETTMIYNTVRDNKYLEKAIDVFDDKYEVAAEPVREDESKTKYYRPPKKKTAEDTPQEPEKPVPMDELTRRVAAYMEEHGITDLAAFLSDLDKPTKTSRKSEPEM